MGSSRITGAPNNTIFTRYIHSFKESEKNCEKIPTMGFPSFFLLLHVLIATITDARVLSEGTSTSTLTPGFSSSPLTAMSTPMPSGTSTLLSTSPSARISLYPVNASLSSSYYGGYYPATKCIDGITNDGDWGGGPGNDGMCHTMRDLFPWIALDFGSLVMVKRVEIVNRSVLGARTRNIHILVGDQLPASGGEMFTEGALLGQFDGPGTNGQTISITGDEMLAGRYVIVQMDNGEDPLNLKEVTAFGTAF